MRLAGGWDFERRRATFLVRGSRNSEIVPRAFAAGFGCTFGYAHKCWRARETPWRMAGSQALATWANHSNRGSASLPSGNYFVTPPGPAELLGEIELHIHETRALVRDIAELSRRIAACSLNTHHRHACPVGPIAARS